MMAEFRVKPTTLKLTTLADGRITVSFSQFMVKQIGKYNDLMVKTNI